MTRVVARLACEQRPAPDAAIVVRGGVAAWFADRAVHVAMAGGGFIIGADWPIDRIELSPDGGWVLALGDDGKRAQVWEVATATRGAAVDGDLAHRESLRVGLAEIAGRAAIVSTRRKQGLEVLELRTGAVRARVSLSGMIAMYVTRVVSLEASWCGLIGFRHAEQYDTALVVPAAELATDDQVVQTALRERPSVTDWGYRVALGPAGPGHAALYRDAEWDDDDRPDDPVEAFRGVAIWDLSARAVVQRIDYAGAIASAAAIGADARIVAAEVGRTVEVIERASGSAAAVPGAVALDPYRLDVVRVRDDGWIELLALAD